MAWIHALVESGVLGRAVVGVRIYCIAECFIGRFASMDRMDDPGRTMDWLRSIVGIVVSCLAGKSG